MSWSAPLRVPSRAPHSTLALRGGEVAYPSADTSKIYGSIFIGFTPSMAPAKLLTIAPHSWYPIVTCRRWGMGVINLLRYLSRGQVLQRPDLCIDRGLAELASRRRCPFSGRKGLGPCLQERSERQFGPQRVRRPHLGEAEKCGAGTGAGGLHSLGAVS